MKEGKKEESVAARERVVALKESSKELDETLKRQRKKLRSC